MTAAVGVKATQAVALAAGAYPSAGLRATQALALFTNDAKGDVIRVPQALVLVAAAGSVSDPHVRVWSYTLDGHDHYILRLGNVETLDYDATVDSWTVVGSGTANLWRAFTGGNWLGGRAVSAWSDVVVGDDANGALYFLSTDNDFDDDPVAGSDTPRSFDRVVTGQLVIASGYAAVPIFGLQLFGSVGAGDDGLSVSLATSDDQGQTWDDMGAITLGAGDYTARCDWRSLGSARAPGRLFRITDSGALKRIDSLDTGQ